VWWSTWGGQRSLGSRAEVIHHPSMITSLITNLHPPLDHHWALGIVLLKGRAEVISQPCASTTRESCSRNHAQETRDLRPEPRNQKTETRNQKPETRNQKTENRRQKPETRNWGAKVGYGQNLLQPKPLNPISQTSNPKPQTPNPKPQTPGPKPQTPNPQSLTHHPSFLTPYPLPLMQTPPHPTPHTPPHTIQRLHVSVIKRTRPKPHPMPAHGRRQTPNPKPQI
jgi:hypothetical protein